MADWFAQNAPKRDWFSDNAPNIPTSEANRALAGTGLSVSGPQRPKPPFEMQGPPNPEKKGFAQSALDVIKGPVAAVKDFVADPSGARGIGEGLAAVDQAREIMKRDGVGEDDPRVKALLDKAMGVRTPTPIAGQAVPFGTEPVLQATNQALEGDIAGGAGTLVGAAALGTAAAAVPAVPGIVRGARAIAAKPRGPVGPVLTAVGDAVPIPAVKLGTSLANVGKRFNEWRNGPEPVPYPAGKGTGTKYGGPAAPFDEGASRLPPRTPAALPDEPGPVPPVDVKFTPSTVTKRNMPKYGGPSDESASVSSRNRPRQGVNRAMEPEPEPEAPVTAKPPGLKWNPKPKAEGKPKSTKSEPPATVETKPPQRPPASEQAYPAPEGAEPNYSAPKEHYMKQARTVRAKAVSRLFRDEPENYQGWQEWKPGDARWKKASEGAGVTVPNSPESIQAIHDEFGKLPPKKANGIPRASVNRQELIDAAMASERDPDFAIRRAEELGYRVA